MPNQSAAQDDNQVFALIAHSGTAGTSDTIRVVADSAGNLGVNIAGTEPIELVAGTITRVSTVGTLELGSVVINGTPTVSNLGTNVNVVTGTVNVGTTTVINPTGTTVTIDHGTVQNNPRPSRNILSYGTSSIAAAGTLVAAPGVGTSIWAETASIVVASGTQEVLISWGTQTGGTAVLVSGLFTPGGGIQKTFNHPVNGGITNTALTWNVISGSGTTYYNVSYWNE